MFIAAATLELERTAAAYRDSAKALASIPDRAESYLAHVQQAAQVQWHSPAGEAFRALVEALRYPGSLLQTESMLLAAKAETIAADLSSLADAARQLGTLLAVLSAMDFTEVAKDLGAARLDSMRNAAAEATVDAAKFVQYMQDNGGIPWLLQEAASRVW